MKLIFRRQKSMKVSYKFRLTKIASLQYLYNISKKKLGMEFIFYMQKKKKFLQASINVFDGIGGTCPKYQKQEIGNIFATYYEKSIATAFVFYCDAKHTDIYGGPVTFIVTCFWVAVS